MIRYVQLCKMCPRCDQQHHSHDDKLEKNMNQHFDTHDVREHTAKRTWSQSSSYGSAGMRLHANARKTSKRTSLNVKVETTYIAPSRYAPPHNTVRDTIVPREEFRGRVEPLRHVSNATLELFVRTKYFVCERQSHAVQVPPPRCCVQCAIFSVSCSDLRDLRAACQRSEFCMSALRRHWEIDSTQRPTYWECVGVFENALFQMLKLGSNASVGCLPPTVVSRCKCMWRSSRVQSLRRKCCCFCIRLSLKLSLHVTGVVVGLKSGKLIGVVSFGGALVYPKSVDVLFFKSLIFTVSVSWVALVLLFLLSLSTRVLFFHIPTV